MSSKPCSHSITMSVLVALFGQVVLPPEPAAADPPLRYIDIYGIPGQGPLPKEEAPAPTPTPHASGTTDGSTGDSAARFPDEETEGKTEGKKSEAPAKKKEENKEGRSAKPPKPIVPRETTTRPRPSPQSGLVPPPPATPVLLKAEGHNDPLQSIIFHIASGQDAQALTGLDSYLYGHPNDHRAHYLRAVVSVRMRRYSEASAEYNYVIKSAPKSPLAEKAAKGLKLIEQSTLGSHPGGGP